MPNENHISEEEFLLEFFGLDGRILGNPPYAGRKRYFTDNPNSIFECMKFAEANKLPAFISVQPFEEYGIVKGIEKLFFDFDYGKKSDKLTPKKIEKLKAELDLEVKMFVYTLQNRDPKLNPMIIKTNKGYHVYIYLDKVYEFSDKQEFVKEVYKTLVDIIKRYGHISFLDASTDEDLVRLCRIPFSVHQASGKKCMLLKLNSKREFEEDKLRGLSYYRDKGLKYSDVINAVKETTQRLDKEERERESLKTQISTGQISQGGGEIRPCYLKSLQNKEMEHLKRLSLLGEAWYSGKKDSESLVQLFANMNDFNLEKTHYYVKYFLDGKNYLKYPPYKCETMRKLGWCLESNECPIWRKNYEGESK
jgi:hypothetical protein